MTKKNKIIIAVLSAIPVVFLGLYIIVAKVDLVDLFTETREEKKIAIEAIINNKYSVGEERLRLTIYDEYNRHLSGVYFLGNYDSGSSRMFFAVKTEDGWELAFDDNGAVPCNKLEKYNFPMDMRSICWEGEVSSEDIQAMIGLQTAILDRHDRTKSEVAFLVIERQDEFAIGKFAIENQSQNQMKNLFGVKIQDDWLIADPVYGDLFSCDNLFDYKFPGFMKQLCQ